MTESIRAPETSLAQLHTEEEGLATAEYGIVMLANYYGARTGF
ncbi:hypothetical protein ACFP47_11410 [Nesterenkonia lacusekhoensis]|uniref:Uncharacterized protein n=1 Tax=Nesterenkonia lacusekhoensis TaxID=150832 RepID=A0ABS4T519_9MICC|nr:hypothetical protein [Nesterenkonia lacusekhoensis]MBP2319513.1 hypothetical protein [Nesterenkonia lacusekhoensis]